MSSNADKPSESHRDGQSHERGFSFQNAYWLWLSAIVLIVDQVTKRLILEHVALFERIPLLDVLNITYLRNTGAAFSIFSWAEPWMFAALAVVVAIGILIWLRRHPHGQRLVAVALCLILGGALGNAIDRVVYGYVVDFIDFHIGAWHYPAFNVADCAIVIGACLMALDIIWPRRQHGADE